MSSRKVSVNSTHCGMHDLNGETLEEGAVGAFPPGLSSAHPVQGSNLVDFCKPGSAVWKLLLKPRDCEPPVSAYGPLYDE